IEIGAELAVPAIALGQVAVCRVGQSGQQEQQEGRLHLMVDDQPDDEWNEHESSQRDAVGDVHVCSSRRRWRGSSPLGPPRPHFNRFEDEVWRPAATPTLARAEHKGPLPVAELKAVLAENLLEMPERARIVEG